MEKDDRPATGLILGKFLPPHCGHVELIERAVAAVQKLTILVCSLSREPIPGRQRVEWVGEIAPRAEVLHVTDENPSLPEEHPRFWEIWMATIRGLLPSGPDVVFSGEPYGEELARRLGARHVLVDRRRSSHPSGTEIRRDPMAHWEALPACVRPYFVRRVVLTGSESTGKTTLAQELAGYYATAWVPEFARGYLDGKGLPVLPSDIEPIARGQIESEERAAREANRVVILDTDLLSTVVYSEHYFGFCPPEVRAAADRRRAHLYLLAGIDVVWEPDPQRDRPHLRENMQGLFRAALRSRDCDFVEISGSREERRARAMVAIDALLDSSPEKAGDATADQ